MSEPAPSESLFLKARRLLQQVEQTRTLIETEIFMPVKGLLNGYADRCAGCVFTQLCDA